MILSLTHALGGARTARQASFAALVALALVSCRSGAHAVERVAAPAKETLGAPRLEVVFTRPMDEAKVGTSAWDTGIRDTIERLLYAAEDVPSATDVHIAAYDWDQFWNGGPNAGASSGAKSGWPGEICGETFCCDGVPDCNPKGHRCGGPGCGPFTQAPYCKVSWDPIDALVGRGLEIEAVFNRGKSKEPVREWLTTRMANAECRHFDASDADRWCGVRTCGRGMRGQCVPGGACLGDGNMHVKMVLLRKLSSGSEYNAFLTSGNFDYDQLLRWNDAVTILGDKALYAGLRAYYQALWDGTRSPAIKYADALQVPDGSIGADGTIVGAHGIVTAYLFPRDEYDPKHLPEGRGLADVDIVCRLLERIRSGSVRIAMAWFSKDRPWLVDALTALERRGVQVQIIVDGSLGTDKHDEKFTVDQAVTDALSAAGIEVRVATVNIHHKMILVSGTYDGVEQRLVFTGSHNFTLPALRHNDEILVQIKECETPPCGGTVRAEGPPNTGNLRNNDLFERYSEQWSALCLHSKRYGTGATDTLHCAE